MCSCVRVCVCACVRVCVCACVCVCVRAFVDASDASGRERRTVCPCLLTVIGSQPVAKQTQCVHGEVDSYRSRRVSRL